MGRSVYRRLPMRASCLPLHPETELFLRYDKPAADPQRRKAVLVQKLVGT